MINKKILYVEDDLFNNISTIKILFKSFLTKEVLDDLDNLRKLGGDGLAIGNNEIKEVLDKSSLIEVEYSFLSALNKIENTPENYSLFIIDRDLSEKVDNINYKKEIEIIKNKNIGYKEEYNKRSGDFLFLMLFLNTNINLLDSFYFLTANSNSEFIFNDTIESIAILKKNFDLKLFKERNRVAKDKNKKKSELARNIEKYQKNYQYIIKNQKYLKIFKDYNIDDSLFLQILKEHDKIDYNNYNDDMNEKLFESLLLIGENGELERIEHVNKSRIGYNLLLIRKVFEELLNKLANQEKIRVLEPIWWQFTEKKEKSNGKYKFSKGNVKDILKKPTKEKVVVKNFIRFLADMQCRYLIKEIKEYIDDLPTNNDSEVSNKDGKLENLNKIREQSTQKTNYFYNEVAQLDVSSVIAHNLYSIWETTSAFGAHTSKGYQPTLDTINSLIYRLKEIILWFGQVMENIDKP